MINLETAKLTNAINRAKQIRPRVRMTAERTYTVTGSKGANYTVFFAVAKDAKGRPVRMGECTCEAGRNEMPCFHLAAAAALNIAIHTMRQQAREAAKAASVAPVEQPQAAPQSAPSADLESCVTCGKHITPEQTRYIGGKRYCGTVCSGEAAPVADDRATLIESVKAAWHRARPFAGISDALRQVFGVTDLDALSNENLMQVRAALQR